MRLNRQGFKIGKCKRKAILAEFGIFKDIQAYSAIIRHNQAHSVQRKFVLVKTLTFFRLPRRLQDFFKTCWKTRNCYVIMTKTDNYFVISLDFGYVLHRCNAKKLLIYSHDINECVDLKGDLGKKDVFKTSWKMRICTSWKNEKLFRCRYLRGVFKTYGKQQMFAGNNGIFRTLKYSKPEAYSEPWYVQSPDIQNPFIFRTRSILSPLSNICDRAYCENS